MIIKPVKKLTGKITVPGDKSISHRAVMLGAVARGTTRIKNLLDCDDCNYTIGAFKAMGVNIYKTDGETVVEGRGLSGLVQPGGPINVGESGTSMRLLAGIVAGQKIRVTLTGSGQLLKRPMKRITEPLSLMGVDITSSEGGLPPIEVTGGEVDPIIYSLPVASAQVKSAVLFAGLYANGVTVVEERLRSRDHTERMMEAFGASIRMSGSKVSLTGPADLSARGIEVPGDISSAAFLVAGAVLLKGSKIRIENVGVNPTRSGAIDVLKRMGAKVEIHGMKGSFEPFADIVAEGSDTRGVIIEESEIPGLIDELPVIFAVAALSKGRTVIKKAGELRVKETDRISSMQANLSAMGADIRTDGEDVVIEGVESLKGAKLKSFGDHRTCMASAIAALAADSPSEIDDIECVNKSFPGFFNFI
jgi:3-phosphoshikimate 1-carboxyvinyltransferase